MIDISNIGGVPVAYYTGGQITGVRSALGIMGALYGSGCGCVAVPKESFSPAFFDLKTGIAGEVLQKFSNYGVRLAIVGDFSAVKSRALAAFIRECNRGSQVFFGPDAAAAAAALMRP